MAEILQSSATCLCTGVCVCVCSDWFSFIEKQKFSFCEAASGGRTPMTHPTGHAHKLLNNLHLWVTDVAPGRSVKIYCNSVRDRFRFIRNKKNSYKKRVKSLRKSFMRIKFKFYEKYLFLVKTKFSLKEV